MQQLIILFHTMMCNPLFLLNPFILYNKIPHICASQYMFFYNPINTRYCSDIFNKTFIAIKVIYATYYLFCYWCIVKKAGNRKIFRIRKDGFNFLWLCLNPKKKSDHVISAPWAWFWPAYLDLETQSSNVGNWIFWTPFS